MIVLCEAAFVLINSLIAVVNVAFVGSIVACDAAELIICTPKLVLVGVMLVLGAEELVVTSAPTAVVVTGLTGSVFALDASALLLVVAIVSGAVFVTVVTLLVFMFIGVMLSDMMLQFAAVSVIELVLTSIVVTLASTVVELGKTASVLIVVLNMVVLGLSGAIMVISSVDLIFVPMPTDVFISVLEKIVFVLGAAAFVVILTVDTVEGMLDNSVLVLCAAELNVVVTPSAIFVVIVLVSAVLEFSRVAPLVFAELKEAEVAEKVLKLAASVVAEMAIVDKITELPLLVPEATVLVLCVTGLVFVAMPAVLLVIVVLGWSLLVLSAATLPTIECSEEVAIIAVSLLVELYCMIVVEVVKGAVNVLCGTSVVGEGSLDATVVIMVLIIIGVMSKVFSIALTVLEPIAVAVVESNKTISLASTELELGTIVFVLIVASDAVEPFVFVGSIELECGASALVGVTFSMLKVVSDRDLLVFKEAALMIVLVIGAALPRLAGAEFVLAEPSLMLVVPISVFDVLMIACVMLVLYPAVIVPLLAVGVKKLLTGKLFLFAVVAVVVGTSVVVELGAAE